MTQKDTRRFNIKTGPDTAGEVVIEFVDQKFSNCILPALNWKERSLDWFSFHETVSKTIKNIQAEYRSKPFEAILESAEQGIRDLLSVPDNYRILFLQGGATLQFSMIPINFFGADETADYVITGAWGKKALKEAKRCGTANVIYSSAEHGFKSVPTESELNFSPGAKYVHYTSNETIEGVEFKYDLDGGGVPVVCDASSNILSKPINVRESALIYAGAQKNIGPSGVTLVIIRDDLVAQVPENQHSMLDYRLLAENISMLNTPNT